MPKLAVAPSLTRIATVRFSPNEYNSLVTEANERGISVSDLIRRTTMDREIPPQRTPHVDAQMVIEMNRIGANLNQALHTFHRWDYTESHDKRDLWERWRSAIRELAGTLKVLEARLL